MRLFTAIGSAAAMSWPIWKSCCAASSRPRRSIGVPRPICTSPPSSSANGRKSGLRRLKAALAADAGARRDSGARAAGGLLPECPGSAQFLVRHRGAGTAGVGGRYRRGDRRRSGSPREKRPYSPAPDAGADQGARPSSARCTRRSRRLPSLEFGAFSADRFFLYRSSLHPSGSVYTKLAEFPLTRS